MKNNYASLLFGLLIIPIVSMAVGPGPADDVLRRTATQALANYEARLKEAERRHNLTSPPGTDDAIKTGEFMKIMQPRVENIGIGFVDDEFYRALFAPRSKEDYFQEHYKDLVKANKPDLNVLRFLKTRQISTPDAAFQAQLIRNIVQPFTNDPDVMSESLREKIATLELKKNAKNSTPYQISDFIKENAAGLTADEKSELINFVVSQTSYSAAYASLYELLAKRLVDPSAPKLAGQTGNKSLLEAMHVESTRRVESAEWYTELAVMPRDSLLREIAHMQAFHLWLQYEQYRQQELSQFMMASLLSQVQRALNSMGSQMEASRDTAKTDSIANNPD